MHLLPLPAPETPAQRAIAERPLRERLRAPLLASATMLALLLALVFVPALRSLPDLFGVHDGIGRGVILEVPIAIAVLLLVRGFAGFSNLGLQLRGAAVSVALAMPILLLSLADAKIVAMPSVPTLLGAVLLAAIVGFVEEVYGRGLLVTLLGGRRHAVLAILGSSVLFAYLHLPIYIHRHGLEQALLRCTASAVFSAVFATIRLRSGSLVGPIVFHAVNDAQYLLVGAEAPVVEARATAQPVFVGAAVAVVYWLACRRAIAAQAP